MDWIDLLESEGRELLTVARRDPGAPVPACPGWDVTELLRHTGVVHRRAELIVRERLMERPTRENGLLPEAPDDGVLDWFGQGLAALVDAFRHTDPATPVWSFHPPDRTAGFWPRRMAHETIVHRVDVEQATGGAVGPIAPAVAVDGVDELLDVFLPRFRGRSRTGAGETIHLHATDADGEWFLTLGDEGVAVERGHAKGDAAVRGPARALYLWLWGRSPVGELEVFGDQALAPRLRELTTF